jgi:hypothetical protein
MIEYRYEKQKLRTAKNVIMRLENGGKKMRKQETNSDTKRNEYVVEQKKVGKSLRIRSSISNAFSFGSGFLESFSLQTLRLRRDSEQSVINPTALVQVDACLSKTFDTTNVRKITFLENSPFVR